MKKQIIEVGDILINKISKVELMVFRVNDDETYDIVSMLQPRCMTWSEELNSNLVLYKKAKYKIINKV